eukprot:513931_1
MSLDVYFSIVVFISFLWLLDANCNLFRNNGSAYIDTESEKSILTMCNGEISELSLWEQYQCEYIENRDGVTRCWPQRRMSHCNPGNLKGAIFLYHGFSACPNYYNQFAQVLLADCWHVYQMLTIGHGYNYCINNENNDTSCAKGQYKLYNLTQLPTSRQPYIDYVKMMNNVIRDEVSIIKQCENNNINLQVVIGGLSFGAPLASASVLLAGKNSLYTKQLIMSPEFIGDITQLNSFSFTFYNCLAEGINILSCFKDFIVNVIGINNIININLNKNLTNIFLDINNINSETIYTSYSTFMLIISGIIEWMVEIKPEIQLVKDLLNSIIIWDDICELDIEYRDRGGFCVFGMNHFLATVSFANYVMKLAAQKEKENNIETIETLLIVSERDGLFWNSFAINYVRMFYNYNNDLLRNKVNNCMWLIANQCKSNQTIAINNNNICGVPHSFMSEAANTGIKPYYVYWREQQDNGIRSWMDGMKPEVIHNFMVQINTWDESRNQCVELDVFNPPKQFIFINNELRDKIIKFYNIDYSLLILRYFNNSTP